LGNFSQIWPDRQPPFSDDREANGRIPAGFGDDAHALPESEGNVGALDSSSAASVFFAF
jgi:hypothetical protein